jgi:hypothetical protein
MSKQSENSEVATPESDKSAEKKPIEGSDSGAKNAVKSEAVKFSKGSSKVGKTPAPSSKF